GLDLDDPPDRRCADHRCPAAAAVRLLVHRQRGELLDQLLHGHADRGGGRGRHPGHHPDVRRGAGRPRVAERRRHRGLLRRGRGRHRRPARGGVLRRHRRLGGAHRVRRL
ncbi:MAG: hypothetical protein AVDCRST_MAG52-2282, partial [uncultured Blastococcus sp.]